MTFIIERYLNTNDRSIGPCPHRGKGGAVGTKGGVFPQPKAGCIVFINTRRNQAQCLMCIKLFLPRLAFRKPYNQPSAEEMHPLF
mgnify:CR=1 FL=1